MRKKKNLWSGVSILIVAVLVITAFIRGNAQAWLLAAAFVIWAVWATYYFLVPYIKEELHKREAKRIRKKCEKQDAAFDRFIIPEVSDPVEQVLLRHANYRISAYARIDGEDLFLDPKTPKSNRKITLPQFVCDLVKDYADRLYGYDPSDRLFEVTKHYLKHEMERGCKKTGLREIRVHDLRHSHASLLIELGFAPLLISERLGHESVTTTLEIYSHLYPTKHGEVADRLEAFA